MNRREYLIQFHKEWYKRHKQHCKEYARKWKENNPDKIQSQRKRYYTKHYQQMKAHWINRKHRLKTLGLLTKNTLQKVYETNIKHYGTLICVICNKPIEFGQDSIEHLIPICRGGNNDYSNLGISHRSCNHKKGRKTLQEVFQPFLTS